MFSKIKQEKGQGLVEYAIILSLVAIVVIGTMTVLGKKTCATFAAINSSLPSDGSASYSCEESGSSSIPEGYYYSAANDYGVDEQSCVAGTAQGQSSSWSYVWGEGSQGVGCYGGPS